MKEIRITYDDGRPDCAVSLETMVSDDPFAWDGAVREGRIDPAEGYPAPRSTRIATRQLLRTDRIDEEGLRLDLTWWDSALTEQTESRCSHVSGVSTRLTYEQAGRTVILVNPEDIGHVMSVEVDGGTRLQRRFGELCDVGRLGAAMDRYGAGTTPVFPRAVVGDRPSSLAEACALHELIRRDHPEWHDAEASERLGHPVWQERMICEEHGYTLGAWWRTAARAAADGACYSPAGSAVAEALVWRPAVAWARATADGDAGLADIARALLLPDVAADGRGALEIVKGAWREGAPLVDDDGGLARALGYYGVGCQGATEE